MRRYEIVFRSVNTESYGKPITALVIEPERLSPGTGAMLFTHGWGGNRFQYEEAMAFAVERFDLVCVSVEFRGSGYDFDPAKGHGACCPYDASFYQVFDVLNGLRTVLSLRPGIDRSRLFHYGGSQGGHIALLGAIFAPWTFAFVYTSCAVTYLDERFRRKAGREFSEYELGIRDVVKLADRIGCPVFLEHGTADETVPHGMHAVPLERRLRDCGKLAGVKYYEGGGHSLAPVTTRLEAFKATAPKFLDTFRNDREDDFSAGRTVRVPCGDRTLVVDWSRPPDDPELFRWERR